MEAEQFISIKEAAAQFNISDAHLRLLARRSRLKAIKLGRDWFTTSDAVAAYLANTELRSKDPHKNKRS